MNSLGVELSPTLHGAQFSATSPYPRTFATHGPHLKGSPENKTASRGSFASLSLNTPAGRFLRSRNSQRGDRRLTTNRIRSFTISTAPGHGKTRTPSLGQFLSSALAYTHPRGHATRATTTTTLSPSHGPSVDIVTGCYTQGTMSTTRKTFLPMHATSLEASVTNSSLARSPSDPSATASHFTSKQASLGSTSRQPAKIHATRCCSRPAYTSSTTRSSKTRVLGQTLVQTNPESSPASGTDPCHIKFPQPTLGLPGLIAFPYAVSLTRSSSKESTRQGTKILISQPRSLC